MGREKIEPMGVWITMDKTIYYFLATAKNECKRMEIITRNGYHIYGKIVSFGDKAILVNTTGDGEELVMLNAVSTIRPTASEGKG